MSELYVIHQQFSNSSLDGLWLERYETTPLISKGMVRLSQAAQ
jgi:hypothetical protein